jgi:hypothetical protein
MKVAAPFFLLAVLSFGCTEKSEQKRVLVIDKVSCNLGFANEKIESNYGMMDLMVPGNRMRSLGGYKSECADKGYSVEKDGEKVSEVEAISKKCDLEYNPIESTYLDQFLSKGGKIVSTSEFSGKVAVFDNSGRTQPGNGCNGKEYIIEGPVSAYSHMATSE